MPLPEGARDASIESVRSAPRRRTRNRATTACDTCRNRRTRCDNQRPSCGYCRRHAVECRYEPVAAAPSARLEAELAAINQRLDYLTAHLPPLRAQTVSSEPDCASESCRREESHPLSDDEKAPFQLLGTERFMKTLGLGSGFAHELLQLEQDVSSMVDLQHPRLRMIQQQQAVKALAAFSAHVHPWYPILRPGFSEFYLTTISASLKPCAESCLALLVAAVGLSILQDFALGTFECEDTAEQFIEAAMSSLPVVLVDSSITSVQCLLLLSIYNCCAMKPCRAYDYATIASTKIRNLLKILGDDVGELHEQAKRAFWAILLIESELRAQFDLVESGIWNDDDRVALPDSRRTWQFDVDGGSPLTTTSLTSSIQPATPEDTDQTQSYFLAEIAMRRMLHRCNTAIHKTAHGRIVYAPGIAQELELQLEEWYSYLPSAIRFDSHQDLDFNSTSSPDLYSRANKLSNFLRVQYYCCKISIYWPAAYQCIQTAMITYELSEHCQRFFNAYIQLMPSILTALKDCIVNRWTIYASIFMTSMAAIQAASTPCIKECAVDWPRLVRCLQSTWTVDRQITSASPSLSLLADALSQRLSSFLGDVNVED